MQGRRFLLGLAMLLWPARALAQAEGGVPAQQGPPALPLADEPAPAASETETETDAETETEAKPAPVAATAAAPEPAPATPTTLAAPKLPKDRRSRPGYLPGYRRRPSLGISPHTPPTPSLPAGVSPSFMVPPPTQEFVLGINGYMAAALAMGFGSRTHEAGPNQSGTVLHTGPEVPGQYGSFAFTGTVPGVWGELKFVYGNQRVSANVQIAGWRFGRPEGYYLPAGHLGINQAFLDFRLLRSDKLQLQWKVGAFSDLYGQMGEWGEGQYGSSLIANVTGAGETLYADYALSPDLSIRLEHGVKAMLDKAPLGIKPGDPSVGWAYPAAGSTYVHHAHVAATFRGALTGALHYAHGFSHDDRGDPIDDAATTINERKRHPDGSADLLGADLRFRGGHLGFLFLGVGYADIKHAQSLQPAAIRALNAGSRDFSGWFGPEVLYDDSDISGRALNVGFEYDVSVGSFLRHPIPSPGDLPDLRLSLFGVHQSILETEREKFQDDSRLKLGTELSYSALKWLVLVGRVDRVMPELDDQSRAFTVVSPRIVFRTSWYTKEQVFLQYAHWFYGDNVVSMSRVARELDKDMIAISASLGF